MKNNIKNTVFLLATVISASTLMLNAMQENQNVWILVKNFDGNIKPLSVPESDIKLIPVLNRQLVERKTQNKAITQDNPLDAVSDIDASLFFQLVREMKKLNHDGEER